MSSTPAYQCGNVVASPEIIHYAEEDPAVTRFRELLSIRTVSLKSLDTPGPQPDYCKLQLAIQGIGAHCNGLIQQCTRRCSYH